MRRRVSSPSPLKEPVRAALAGPYGHPFHPILVTVPVGAWVASLVFDIARRAGRGDVFRWLPVHRARTAVAVVLVLISALGAGGG